MSLFADASVDIKKLALWAFEQPPPRYKRPRIDQLPNRILISKNYIVPRPPPYFFKSSSEKI